MLLNGNPTNTCGTYLENLDVMVVGMFEKPESGAVVDIKFPTHSRRNSRKEENFNSNLLILRELKLSAERFVFTKIHQSACDGGLATRGWFTFESLSRAFARALRIALQVLSVVMLLNGNPTNT
jgi:hypothetical protein